MELNYHLVDVFTDMPYTGNPLAVVLDADSLQTEQMAAIAREFNLSETTFVLAPTETADYRIRIFTPASELPFAGHPSVGTAATLVRLGLLTAGELVQECGAGLLPVRANGQLATLTGGEPIVGDQLAPEPLLAVAGLDESDLAPYRPARASAGLKHTFLPVRDDAVGKAALDLVAARTNEVDVLYLFSWDEERRHAHARFFGPGVGVMEDPATGSAALAFGVWLVAGGLVPGDGETAYTIQQGIEMGRPSLLECTVTAAAGQAIRTTVTGRVVPVATGQISVPS